MNSPSLDAKEVAKFEALADEWWDMHGKLRTLHHVNPVRLAFIQSHISPLQSDKALTILDVGCGGGILTESLARQGHSMTGIDASKSAIEAAQHHAQQVALTIDYEETLLDDKVKTQSAHFDALTCMELLEHVADPAATIQQCAKLVKPGGLLFFSTLNRTLKAYVLAIIGAEYILNLLPKGTHAYEKLIKPAELDEWARAAGLSRIAITGLAYNPFTQQAKLVRDVSVNFLTCYSSIESTS